MCVFLRRETKPTFSTFRHLTFEATSNILNHQQKAALEHTRGTASPNHKTELHCLTKSVIITIIKSPKYLLLPLEALAARAQPQLARCILLYNTASRLSWYNSCSKVSLPGRTSVFAHGFDDVIAYCHVLPTSPFHIFCATSMPLRVF